MNQPASQEPVDDDHLEASLEDAIEQLREITERLEHTRIGLLSRRRNADVDDD